MQSQYEDSSECIGRCTGYGVLDMCWMGRCEIQEVQQHTVDGMGEERQGYLHTLHTVG